MTSAYLTLGWQEGACAWGSKKSCDVITQLAILCCHLVCGSEETKSTSKSYADKKRPKKRKRLGRQMMHGKAIWKSRISEIAKTSREIGLRPYKVGLQHPISTSSCKGQCGGINWVMANGNKTQSLMKNGGQQKCLDKALL